MTAWAAERPLAVEGAKRPLQRRAETTARGSVARARSLAAAGSAARQRGLAESAAASCPQDGTMAAQMYWRLGPIAVVGWVHGGVVSARWERAMAEVEVEAEAGPCRQDEAGADWGAVAAAEAVAVVVGVVVEVAAVVEEVVEAAASARSGDGAGGAGAAEPACVAGAAARRERVLGVGAVDALAPTAERSSPALARLPGGAERTVTVDVPPLLVAALDRT